MKNSQRLIRPLIEGPLDLIGDVHGEIDALRALLERLHYRDDGSHPDNRHLIFVGDLCDRGPDSPAVIKVVRRLVEEGRAQCILGNHELNLLRRDLKHGNHWFLERDDAQYRAAVAEFGHSVRSHPDEEASVIAFLESLPLALERDDLRVVHATWDTGAIELVRGIEGSVNEAFIQFDNRLKSMPGADALRRAAHAEKTQYKHLLKDRDAEVPQLTAHATYEEFYQNNHPLRVLTSGLERVTAVPFFASGQWRFVERVPWWTHYRDVTPVVFGHYWRWHDRTRVKGLMKDGLYPFGNDQPDEWHRNLDGHEVGFCVDFSAGVRFKERQHGRTERFHGRLAALRWPEKTVVFDEELANPSA